MRRTNWVFKLDRYIFVLKGLMWLWHKGCVYLRSCNVIWWIYVNNFVDRLQFLNVIIEALYVVQCKYVVFTMSLYEPHGVFCWSFCFWKPYKLRSAEALKAWRQEQGDANCVVSSEINWKAVAIPILKVQVQSLQRGCMEFRKTSVRHGVWTGFHKIERVIWLTMRLKSTAAYEYMRIY